MSVPYANDEDFRDFCRWMELSFQKILSERGPMLSIEQCEENIFIDKQRRTEILNAKKAELQKKKEEASGKVTQLENIKKNQEVLKNECEEKVRKYKEENKALRAKSKEGKEDLVYYQYCVGILGIHPQTLMCPGNKVAFVDMETQPECNALECPHSQGLASTGDADDPPTKP